MSASVRIFVEVWQQSKSLFLASPSQRRQGEILLFIIE